MKARAIAFLYTLLVAIAARGEKISLVGATVINPAEGRVIPNATVVISGDRIGSVAIGKQSPAARETDRRGASP
jgi:hypothetical protein